MTRDDEDALQSSSDFSGDPAEMAMLPGSSNDHVTNTSDNDYGDDYYYWEPDHFQLNLFPFEIPLLGTARPFFILLTILTNTLVVGFFLSIKNGRKASNLLFVSIAFSDTMAGIALLPNSFGIFDGKSEFVTKSRCSFYMYSRLVVSRTFHTVSVWQTVLLAIQRYLCVSYPFVSGRICTYISTLIAILIMYGLATCLHIYHFFNDKVDLILGRCEWTAEAPCVETCVYLWAIVLLQHLLPSLTLLILTILTLISLRKASRKASAMSLSTSAGNHTRYSRDRIITVTTILIVIVFLIPEVPYGIYMLLMVISISHGSMITFFSTQHNRLAMAIYEVVICVTFHTNFWIYCGTMGDFRQALLYLCACGSRRRRLQSTSKFSRSSSSRSRNESARVPVSRASSVAGGRHRVLSNTTSVMSTTSGTYLNPISPSSGARNRTEMTVFSGPEEVFGTSQDGSNNKQPRADVIAPTTSLRAARNKTEMTVFSGPEDVFRTSQDGPNNTQTSAGVTDPMTSLRAARNKTEMTLFSGPDDVFKTNQDGPNNTQTSADVTPPISSLRAASNENNTEVNVISGPGDVFRTSQDGPNNTETKDTVTADVTSDN